MLEKLKAAICLEKTKNNIPMLRTNINVDNVLSEISEKMKR
jgi:hypothetical protein